MKYIIPIILIALSIAGFILLIQPKLAEIQILRVQSAEYNKAIKNQEELDNERDKIIGQYESLGREDLDKLTKLLPDNVDNIRLILEIGELAKPYNMVLKDVHFNTDTEEEGSNNKLRNVSAKSLLNQNSLYGTLEFSFSVEGPYSSFVSFLKDIEKNLRLVDISSVQFTSLSDDSKTNSGIYNYSLTVKTYWLSN